MVSGQLSINKVFFDCFGYDDTHKKKHQLWLFPLVKQTTAQPFSQLATNRLNNQVLPKQLSKMNRDDKLKWLKKRYKELRKILKYPKLQQSNFELAFAKTIYNSACDQFVLWIVAFQLLVFNFIGEMNSEVEINVDDIIKTLLDVRTAKPGKQIRLEEQQILGLIRTAKVIFLQQPMLVQISAPVKVCGDIHGQYYDMLRLFEYGGFPPQSSYLFLGDYVDRGRQGIQTFCLLLALKIKHPTKITILRGNHESASITRIYGFYQQCKSRYNIKLWKTFVDCFNCMPVAAIVQDKILCMHGGLSPDLMTFDQINSIVRPTDIPDTGLLCDLLWADPQASVKMWGESERGVSFVFGQDVIHNFLKKNQLDLVCRAHQVVEDGYEFFAQKRLVTVFSAPNYCGQFNNSGAMMRIEEDLTCSFQVLRPEEKMGVFRNSRPKTPIKRGGS